MANIVYHSGFFHAKLAKLSKDRYLVLMYHRIIPRSEGGLFLQPGMYVEPDTFDMHLDFMKRHFEIRPVAELCNTTFVPPETTKKPVCYITFDDGWIDFYTYAYPILRKHNLPATVFVPTGYIGTGQIFWTDRLAAIFEAIVHSNRAKDLASVLAANGMVSRGDTSYLPHELFEISINRLKQFKEPAIMNVLNRLTEHFKVNPETVGRRFLDWQQVSEIKASGLVSFGSHTVTHRILTNVDNECALSELNDSFNLLVSENIADINSIAFCYPNGCFNDEISRMVKSKGYSCAFTTLTGANNVFTDKYKLYRVPIHQDVSYTKQLLANKVAFLI